MRHFTVTTRNTNTIVTSSSFEKGIFGDIDADYQAVIKSLSRVLDMRVASVRAAIELYSLKRALVGNTDIAVPGLTPAEQRMIAELHDFRKAICRYSDLVSAEYAQQSLGSTEVMLYGEYSTAFTATNLNSGQSVVWAVHFG